MEYFKLEGLNEDDTIVIYGNGKTGKLLQAFFERYNYRNKIYIALSDDENVRESNEYWIHDIKKVCSKPYVVIATIVEKYAQEMILETEKDGYRYYALSTKDVLEIERSMPRMQIGFEVHVTEHCNLNCTGCTHFSPIAKTNYLDVKEWKNDCKRMYELYGDDVLEVRLLGGEPLLHPNLPEIMNVTRDFFKNAQIIILTNGIMLKRMSTSFWDSVKRNSVKIMTTRYPININYDSIKQFVEDKNIEYGEWEMESDNNGDKVLENYHLDIEGKQNGLESLRKCIRANFCLTLKHGKLYTCTIAAHMHHMKEFFSLEHMNIEEKNGISIYEAKDKYEISEFLVNEIPACRYCDIRESVTYIPYTTSRKKMEEWL